MKKLFLLLATGLIATASNGQQAMKSVVFTQNYNPVMKNPQTSHKLHLSGDLNTGRVTAAPSYTDGWFDYADTVFSPNIVNYGGAGDGMVLASLFMWNDTSAIFGYDNSGTGAAVGYGIPSYGYTYMTSTGLTLDPFATDWKTGGSGYSRPLVTLTNAYVIDSVMIVGVYGRPNGATYNDYLHLSFVSGANNLPINGFWGTNAASLLTDYGLTAGDSIFFPNMSWDTTTNGATNNSGGSAAVAYVETLTPTDTSVTFFGNYVYGVNVSVPAGAMAAMSVSFVSGSTTYAPGDSITSGDGHTFYHGSFQPAIAANATSTAYAFPPYLGSTYGGPAGTTDLTSGYYKTEGSTDAGWSPAYPPSWAWTTSTGASYLQYPYILYHVSCPTCANPVSTPVVNNIPTQVKAYPNPASDVVTIAYSLATTSDISVSLTNTMGQVVATQKVAGTSKGSVQFNTSALPEGVYFYTVNSNGTLNTGRIVVAH